MTRDAFLRRRATYFSPLIISLMLLFLAPGAPETRSEDTVGPLNLPKERCSMSFFEADVKDVLRLLAKEYRLNLIISEKVSGLVTLDFEQVPLDDIFYSVLNTAGLGYTVKGDVILIATHKELREEETERVKELEKQSEAKEKIMEARTKTEELVSKMIKVNYILNARATESIAKELAVPKEKLHNLTQLSEALRKMLSNRKGATIEVVDAANALIVTDIPDRVGQIVELIRQLDLPSPQILVEARITIMNSDTVKELGVQWGGRYTGGDLTISGQRSRTTTETRGSTTTTTNGTTNNTDLSGRTSVDSVKDLLVDLPAAVGQGKGGAIGFLLGDIKGDFLDVQLSALEDEGQAKLLARPRVITQDNQKAYIKIGDEIPYLEKTIASGVVTTDLKFKDAAIELEVSPHTVDDEVFLDVVVARKVPDYARAIDGNPPLRAQALTTKVSVKSGQTFAIGGLSLEEEIGTTNAVPFFSRLPLLSFFFKKEGKTKRKDELIIFITPTIMNAAIRGE